MSPLVGEVLLVSAIAPPLLVAVLLAIGAWIEPRPSEHVIQRLSSLAFGVSFLASSALLVWLVGSEERRFALSLDSWFAVEHYAFSLEFVADSLSVPFATFVSCLVGIVGAFSSKYLHREPGYLRYYALLCLFGGATLLLVFAGSLDFAFFGWEIVGLTSTMLIAFFHERREPVAHAFRAFCTYRICDVGLLGAAVWLHHTVGTTTGAPMDVSYSWWGFDVPAAHADQVIVGLLILWASLGKSAQVPFGGWLPRAMEGPTPSSAIFYGAISVHLGPYLLLRAGHLLDATPLVAGLVVLVGAATALHGTLVGRVQTDIKSALAYASMVQVGIIFVEIGFGLRYFALAHIVGHAALRCLQILRSPSILQDHIRFERKLGGPLPRLGRHFERLLPRAVQLWLYRGSLERGFLDGFLRDWFVGPLVSSLRALDALGQHWTDFLLGKKSSPPPAKPLTVRSEQ